MDSKGKLRPFYIVVFFFMVKHFIYNIVNCLHFDTRPFPFLCLIFLKR